MRLLWLFLLHMGDLFHALIGGAHQSQIWGNRREAPVRRITTVCMCQMKGTDRNAYTVHSPLKLSRVKQTCKILHMKKERLLLALRLVLVNISSELSHFMWLLFQTAHRNFPASSWISHWPTFIYIPLMLLIQSGHQYSFTTTQYFS